MFKSRTLFVIGAGGSAEVGLPIGDGLKADICTRMDIRFSDGRDMDGQGDYAIYKALKHHAERDINEYLESCWKIKDGIILANSIDNFIDSHQGNSKVRLCGKLAIVRAILSAERNSRLFLERDRREPNVSIDFASIEDSYFIQLWRILQEGVGVSDVETLFNNLAFITFNYDRCLEHFLYYAIQHHYYIEPSVAGNILLGVPFVHPYGAVGKLPWQREQESVPFGGYDRGRGNVDLLKLSEEINTFTEKIEDTAELLAIHTEIDRAEDIVFLGFSYHPENMRLLTPAGSRKPSAMRVYGTAFGISEPAESLIKNRIAELYPACGPDYIQIRRDLKCAPFLSQYGPILAR